MLEIKEEKKIQNKSELLNIFYSGIKTGQNIGVEVETLAIYKDSGVAVSYNDMVKIIEKFDANKWQKHYENGNLLGLKGEKANITLEPGSQLEISLVPMNTIQEVETSLACFFKHLKEYTKNTNIRFTNLGIQPKSTFDKINIIPKDRYKHMTNLFKDNGQLPFIMMRETAGIQSSFDYKSEQDAIKKLALAIKLSPIVSSIYQNSVVRDGMLSDISSERANSWLNMDDARCGLISKNLIENYDSYTFEDYTDELLNVPMVFIERNSETIPVKNMTFREFYINGYEGYQSTLEDWELHLSLFFPDARLKSYVEIRNHDNQREELIYSVPAFWKGIIYNDNTIYEAFDIVKALSYEDLQEIRMLSPKHGLALDIKGKKLKNYAQNLLSLSYESLKSFRKGEERYLEPIKNLVDRGITPSNIIKDKWNNEWEQDFSKMIKSQYISI